MSAALPMQQTVVEKHLVCGPPATYIASHGTRKNDTEELTVGPGCVSECALGQIPYLKHRSVDHPGCFLGCWG